MSAPHARLRRSAGFGRPTRERASRPDGASGPGWGGRHGGSPVYAAPCGRRNAGLAGPLTDRRGGNVEARIEPTQPARQRRLARQRFCRRRFAMNSWQHAFQSRVDRVIATARVVLAVVGLLAIWLDPAQPAKHADETYMLMAAYVLYAFGVAWIAWREAASDRYSGLPTHVIDLALFSVLMYLTEGPTSPFFVFFTFAILAATLRWQWRGTLWTAAAALAVLLLLGVTAGRALAGEEFELNRLVIRAVYLAVAAALLAYVGLYQERVRRELWTLSTGPDALSRGSESPARDVTAYVARVFGAPRVLMIWFEEDEPWLHLAMRNGSAFESAREPPASLGPIVAEALSGSAFFCADAGADGAAVQVRRGGRLVTWSGAPLHPLVVRRFAVKAVLSLPLAGDGVDGRLLVLDKPAMSADDLLIGEVVAGQVATRMDLFLLGRRLQAAAVAEERVRLARDLHDGVLQDLTGVALQLQAVRHALPRDGEGLGGRLAELQETIAAEQRELREFIQLLKPGSPSPPPALADQLARMAHRLRRQWGLDLAWAIEPAQARIAPALIQEIVRIVAEGAANARRHGRSTRVDVRVRVDDGRVEVVIADNGAGFPFTGRFAHGELAAGGIGPRSLRERVAALGGRLTVESSGAGARLEISLPLGEAAHAH
jgi:signal transduction histidine kinase